MAKDNEINIEQTDRDIADALIASVALRPDANEKLVSIQIPRGDKMSINFKIGSINTDQLQKCYRQNTKNRGLRTEEVQWSRLNAQILFEATVEEDRTRLWQNKKLWKTWNLTNGVECVRKLLTDAEIEAVVKEITDLGGRNESYLDDIIKN